GDRLDTDIAGANAAELPSLMVLCGVNTAADVIWAVPHERPDYLGEDLRALPTDADTLRVSAHPAWRVELDGSTVTVHATGEDPGDSLSVVRAVAAAVWAAEDDRGDRRASISGADETARQAVQRWSLAPPTID
ncbi:MAG: HAD hydrolase-like protein, partial [Mycobacterium sp.]|nr:HAD hydrolase-like protein [Mycobacterium sp.]